MSFPFFCVLFEEALSNQGNYGLTGDGSGKSQMVASVLAGAGSLIAVGGLEFAAHMSHTPYWQIPFITSIALVMGLPKVEAAQPRALIGGHVVCALVGYPLLWLFGSSPWVAALGVGLAVALSLRLKVFHPPAAVNPFLIVNEACRLSFCSPRFWLGPCFWQGLPLCGRV